MIEDTIEIFKTEDFFDSFQLQDNDGAGIDLTGAFFDCWIKKYPDKADVISNSNIIVTLSNQTTNAGEFTVFINRSNYASLDSSPYILRITITINSVRKTYYNAKFCVNA